ncbi:MAG: type II toxin-antitoxin system HicA family toxin [Nanoarchaeota archaeon]
MILRKGNYPFNILTIPNHSELARGTLRANIRQSGLNREEFLNLLNK